MSAHSEWIAFLTWVLGGFWRTVGFLLLVRAFRPIAGVVYCKTRLAKDAKEAKQVTP